MRLHRTSVAGIETNLDYLRAIAAAEVFRSGRVATNVLANFAFAPNSIDVLAPGAQSGLQELPGRLHLWHVGVPPSGPMDERSFRLANAIVGNPEDHRGARTHRQRPDAALQRGRGSRARRRADAGEARRRRGAASTRRSRSMPGRRWRSAQSTAPASAATSRCAAGSTCRSYLGIARGVHAGRVRRPRHRRAEGRRRAAYREAGCCALLRPAPPRREIPPLTRDWELGVIYGPHGAPDFFTRRRHRRRCSTRTAKVHFNSARTGVRLIGPKPQWARPDGGEAGLHPSNIHDNAYAVGAIDFTGDMPIILGPDGPSLGGFVCPACHRGGRTVEDRPAQARRHGVRFVPVRAAPHDPSGARPDGASSAAV